MLENAYFDDVESTRQMGKQNWFLDIVILDIVLNPKVLLQESLNVRDVRTRGALIDK